MTAECDDAVLDADADIRRIKAVSGRLGVRESDLLRFAIRTLLNYFLTKEMANEKAELEAAGEAMPPLPSPRH